MEVKGPLEQVQRHSLFAAWNEEAAADGDRKTQGFFQLRLVQKGMMLRLTYRPGGGSFEDKTGPLPWQEKWHRLEGEWDTRGGPCVLRLDGQVLIVGPFNRPFEGFRWVFIGKDNYQDFTSVPGVIYRNLKVMVVE